MISVVVCTYNRAGYLKKMLDSFFAQSGADAVAHEVIVVDNNSSDHTPAIVEEFKRFPTMRYVFEERQGLCCARNRGVAESRGDIVTFLDDDVLVDPRWLVNLRNCFDATTADVVGGRSYLVFESQPPPWLGTYFRTLLSEVDLGPSRKMVPDGRGLFGLNLAFHKSVLNASGPFREELDRRGTQMLGGGDTAKVREIAAGGGKVVYDPDVAVGHIISPERLEWARFKRQAVAMGRSFAMFSRATGGTVRPVRTFRALGYLCLGPLIILWKRLRGASLYERRVVIMRMHSAAAFLQGRISNLWRSPS